MNVPTQAQYLKPGDVLTATGNTVVSVSAGITTPRGKVDVSFRRPNGAAGNGCWRKTTMIGVSR